MGNRRAKFVSAYSNPASSAYFMIDDGVRIVSESPMYYTVDSGPGSPQFKVPRHCLTVLGDEPLCAPPPRSDAQSESIGEDELKRLVPSAFIGFEYVLSVCAENKIAMFEFVTKDTTIRITFP